jgi:hypothetical protein
VHGKRLSLAFALPVVALVVLRLAPQPAAAAAPSGGQALAYVAAGSTLQVIDTASQQPLSGVPLPGFARAVAVTPDARFALVAVDARVGGLIAVDVGKKKVVSGANIAASSNTVAIAITPDGTTAFVLTDTRFFQISIGQDGALTNIAETGVNTGGLLDLAITPNGRSLYLVTREGSLLRFDVPVSSPVPAATITVVADTARTLRKIVIAPDGSRAYVAVAFTPCPIIFSSVSASCEIPGAVIEVDLERGTTTTSIDISRPAKNLPDPIDLAVATSPAGSSALWVADVANNDVTEIPLPVPAGFTPTKVASLPNHLTALAATPDGGKLEVTTKDRVIGVNTKDATLTCDPAVCPQGDGPIAITPDQRPQTSLTAAPDVAGKVTSFDASSSSVAFGGISIYAWDFGDGVRQATNIPTVSHTYTKPGTYHVALVETDSAGASEAASPPSTIFTGHTITRRGGSPARTTHDVTIQSLPTPTSTRPTSPSPTSTRPTSPSPTSTRPTSPATGVTPTTQSGSAAIKLVPAVGPPGTVAAVSGSGFPANAIVPLVWQQGIGAVTAFADGQGAFHVQMLVFPRDELGPRLLQAQGFGASADFLVVPISVEPAGGSVQLLFRR